MKKKVIIQMFLSVAAVSSYAAVPFTPAQDGSLVPGEQTFKTMHVASRMHSAALPVSRDGEDWNYGKPVYDIPEGGQMRLYSRSCQLFYYDLFNGLTISSDDSFAGEVVFYDNGDVYMRNMIPSMITDTYLVGHLDGDKISLEFPQVLCYEDPYVDDDGNVVDDGFWPVFRASYKLDMEEGTIDVEIDEQTQIMTFTINADGSITQDDDAMLGVFTQGGMWYGESAWDMLYTPFDKKPLTMPEGLQVQKWAVATDKQAYLIDVAFDGSDVYIGGLYPPLPDSVVKGVVQDSKVVLESPTYIGVDPESCHLAFFVGTKTVGKNLQMVNDPALAYDAEAGKMTYNRKYLVVNAGDEKFNILYQLYSPQLFFQPENPVYGNPLKPEFNWIGEWEMDHWADRYDWYAVISIPNVDTNGNFLDTSMMWYNIWFDGEINWFDEEDYHLVEASTDVPWDYDDDENFYVRDFDHHVYFYWTGWEWMGVQSIFEDPEGVLHKSEMAYYGDVEGIPAVATGAEPVSVQYFDLQGRPMSHPTGLCIRRVLNSDGSQTNTKVRLHR